MFVNRDIEHEFVVWDLQFIGTFGRLLKPKDRVGKNLK